MPASEPSHALRLLTESWVPTSASERAAFQPWLIAFCEALGVPAPTPPTEHYTFELPVSVIDKDGRESKNFIDCWRTGHFAMEAKATDVADGNDAPLRKAYGQVRNYAAHVKGASPPYLMVVDVPRTLIVWDRWSGEYGGFPAGYRINLATLHERPDDIQLLQDIFTNPAARDPRGRAQAVTKEIAGKLAELSAAFEDRGHDPEKVARFLMRCVFCFFAEDVDLLPRGLFKRTIETARTAGGPERVADVLTSLWRTMDEGGSFGADLVRRFNGHFFRTVDALPLAAEDVTLLIEAAAFDWSRVEPSIFGTLLVRALDPDERHRLGAEYTPREYIERVVEPTVVEPIRDRWTAVQAHVLQLTDTKDKKPKRIKDDRTKAVKELLDFHAWMRGLRFLDPACGSGNFLYVTMAAVKRIELEVIREIERVRGKEQAEAILEEVHPRQFHGIEVKPWAREIAELTLWIGYHQFWRETHGGRTPPDPVLEDTGTIECRDAILAWDEIVHRPEKDRPDPTPRVLHPVTQELVPDPDTTLRYLEYLGARPAKWPDVDFVIGNPPYLGQARMRDALGDGYVDALRSVYSDLRPSVDLVMYWWHRAAELVVKRGASRAGLITTSSVTQAFNRSVIEKWTSGRNLIRWVAADHPWVDDHGAADVRVSMSVIGLQGLGATSVSVNEDGQITSIDKHERINDDFSTHADVAAVSGTSLLANIGLAHDGVKLHGAGFLLTADEVSTLRPEAAVVRPYLNGRDVAATPRRLSVIDFGLKTEDEVKSFPLALNIVRDRVLPQRVANRREVYRTYWWRFGEPRRELRDAVEGLNRYIITVDTARHRYFTFVGAETIVDDKLVAIASDDAALLAILSSRLHVTWAVAAGGRLGVGNDPVYTKSRCFDAYPFPEMSPQAAVALADLGERLVKLRVEALSRDEAVTMTGMYKVMEKLTAGAALTAKEKAIHQSAACGVLMDLHGQIDARVAAAYGWPWPLSREEILERLVALHDERVAEEKAGRIRWLRPDYQIPRFAPDAPAQELQLKTAKPAAGTSDAPPTLLPWPAGSVEQLGAVKAVAARLGADAKAVAGAFAGADLKLLARHLETLSMMGELT